MGSLTVSVVVISLVGSQRNKLIVEIARTAGSLRIVAGITAFIEVSILKSFEFIVRRRFNHLHTIIEKVIVKTRVTTFPRLLLTESGIGITEWQTIRHTEIIYIVGSRTENDTITFCNILNLIGVHLTPVRVGTVSRATHNGFCTTRHQPVLLFSIKQTAVFVKVYQSILCLTTFNHSKHLAQSISRTFTIIRIV